MTTGASAAARSLAAAPAQRAAERPGRVSLATLSLPQLVGLDAALRGHLADEPTLEDAAQGVVDVLHGRLRDESGAPQLALVRVFTTARASELPPELRQLAGDADDDEPCLSLLATRGALPAWDDRRRSAGHQVVRLGPSAGVGLAAVPMVQGLFREFGVAPSDLDGSGRLAFDDFGVFHVEQAAGSPFVPAQEFVREHGIESVLGFGCGLADGRVVAVLLFSTVRVPPDVAALFRTLAVSLRAALVPLSGLTLFAGMPHSRSTPGVLVHAATRRALEQLVEVLGAEVQKQSAQLHAEIDVVDQLRRLGSDVAAELELERLVDAVVSAAVATTGAQFGAFFYNKVEADGQSYVLYSVAGVARDEFASFPMPSATAVFGPTFRGEGVVRSSDITRDPRYGHGVHGGMPPGHLPVRSYLAAPVVSRSGEVLGGLFLGHPDVEVFDARAEALVVGLAGHAAVGIDNARLFTSHRQIAVELQRSLLPQDVLPRPGLRFDACYEPGANQGATAVGGDWYDVVPLDGARTAVVIGDVMGRGVRAAATMGQLRAALRGLLLSGQSADTALGHLDRLVSSLPDEQIATCLVGIYDPDAGTLSLASAGHLPPLLRAADGAVAPVAVDAGAPLGAGAAPTATEIAFPPGTAVLLYTDGLVERRGQDIDAGFARLIRSFPAGDSVGELLDLMRDEQDADDTAALLVVAAPAG